MDTPAKGNRREKQLNPEERWIRLQEVGLSQILAIPVALMVGLMLGFSHHSLGMIALGLLLSGYVCLVIGHTQRQELRKKAKGGYPGDNIEE